MPSVWRRIRVRCEHLVMGGRRIERKLVITENLTSGVFRHMSKDRPDGPGPVESQVVTRASTGHAATRAHTHKRLRQPRL